MTTPDQETSTYAYDAVTMLDSTQASYAVGRMVKMQRDDTMREMSYDQMGRVTKLLNVMPYDVIGQTWETMTSTYDLAGEQTSLTYPSGRKLGFTYDTQGRLTATNLISINGNIINTPYVSNMTYAPTGALTGQQFGNAIQQNLTYNNRLQITRNQYIGGPASGSSPIADKSFNWFDGSGKNSGLIWGITDNVNPSASTNYLYDNERRLTSSASATYAQTYAYDAFGNQTQAGSFAYDPSNGTGTPYNLNNQPANTTVDGLGNLSPDTTLTFSGNLITNFASTLTFNPQPDPNSAYAYDAAGMRAQVKLPGGHWRETIYLGNTLIAQRSDATPNTWTDIIYSGGQRVAVELPNGKTRYHVTDHLGSIQSVTGPLDNVISSTEMTPFGHVVTDGGNTNLLFTGKERDPETGLDYFGGRYYSSTMNRFISPDPMSLGAANLYNPQSLNLYSYVGNTPLTNFDPSGFADHCLNNNGQENAIGNSQLCLLNGGSWVDDPVKGTGQDENGNDVPMYLMHSLMPARSDVPTFDYTNMPFLLPTEPSQVDPDDARIMALAPNNLQQQLNKQQQQINQLQQQVNQLQQQVQKPSYCKTLGWSTVGLLSVAGGIEVYSAWTGEVTPPAIVGHIAAGATLLADGVLGGWYMYSCQ